MTDRTIMHVRLLAQRMVERAKALNYRGKKADNAALDYFVGAASSAELLGDHELKDHLGRICLLLSVRGMMEVHRLAQGA